MKTIKLELNIGDEFWHINNDLGLVKRAISQIIIQDEDKVFYVFSGDLNLHEFSKGIGAMFVYKHGKVTSDIEYFKDKARAKDLMHKKKMDALQLLIKTKQAELIQLRNRINKIPFELKELEEQYDKEECNLNKQL